MPSDTDLSPKGWKHHFERRDRAARAGRHLPTLNELYCGMSFFNGSLAEDAQAWSERLMTRLHKNDDGTPIESTEIALQRLTVSADIEDLQFVFDAIKKLDGLQNKLIDFQGSARRLSVYRVAAGDASAWLPLCHEIGSRIRSYIIESEELWAATSVLLGLTLNMGGPHWSNSNRVNSLGDYSTDGSSILLKVEKMSRFQSEKPLPKSRHTSDDRAKPEDQALPGVTGPAILVFSGIGNETTKNSDAFSKSLRKIVGEKLPLKPFPKLSNIRRTLAAEFPHAVLVTDKILGDLATRDYIAMRPTVLVGPPGGGKTRFCRRLGELLELPFETYPCAGINDSSLAGTARRWSSGEPAMATALIISAHVANPLIILDEIEKSATSKFNGNLLDALLPFLELESSSKYYDIFVQASVNLSGVVWLATANDVSILPTPLRDRCRILDFPLPTLADLPAILPRLLSAIRTSKGLDERWIAPLNEHEMAAIAAAWSGGSLRSLQRLLEGVLAVRDHLMGKH